MNRETEKQPTPDNILSIHSPDDLAPLARSTIAAMSDDQKFIMAAQDRFLSFLEMIYENPHTSGITLVDRRESLVQPMLDTYVLFPKPIRLAREDTSALGSLISGYTDLLEHFRELDAPIDPFFTLLVLPEFRILRHL